MESSVDEIKSRLKLEDVIREYVQLMPGGMNLRARCPFHNEKTPSFMVSPDKQIWHCFGCGKGGDVFSFITEIEGMEFPEALRVLADRAGVKLKEFRPEQRNHKTRVLDALQIAANWYHQSFLVSQQGEAGRTYGQERKLSDTTIRDWRIGYAPDLWDAALVYLTKKGFAKQELVDTGLFIVKDGGARMYDRFRHRLLFPIVDHQGMVIGFGGRALAGSQTDPGEAKYINSPQTIVYDKSRVLFGLFWAKQAIREQGFVVMVEGYMDVVSSHQSGVAHVVASSGTALTQQQAQLLHRYTSEIALCFDEDTAGERATQRGLDVAWAEGLQVSAITVPFGKDPDDCAREQPEIWQAAVQARKPVMDYLIDHAVKRFDKTTADGKRTIAKTLLPVIQRLADTVEQSHYIQQLASLLRVKEDILWDKIRAQKHVSVVAKPLNITISAPASMGIEELLLALVMTTGELVPVFLDVVTAELFCKQNNGELYRLLKDYYTNGQSEHDVLSWLTQQSTDLGRWPEILLLQASEVYPDWGVAKRLKEFDYLLKKLQVAWIQKERDRFTADIAELDVAGNGSEQLDELQKKLNSLHKELKRLTVISP